MSFFSSQMDFMKRSQSKENFKRPHRHTVSSQEPPSLSPKSSSSFHPIPLRKCTPSHVISIGPAAILTAVPGRPRHKSDSHNVKPKSSKSIPLETSLLARESKDTLASHTGKPTSPQPPSISRSRTSSPNVSNASCAGDTYGISSMADLKRLTGRCPSSLGSNVSDSDISARIRRSKLNESSPSKESRFKLTSTTVTTYPIDEQEMPAMTSSPDPVKRPRNVLRRKSSARYTLTSSTTTFFSSSKFPIGSIQTPTPKLPQSLGHHSASTSDSDVVPRALTPAGAVVAAYKQQEQRREKLTSGWNGRDKEPEDTSFHSTSENFIAIGGPDDDWQNLDFCDERTVRSPATVPNDSGLKKLSRKVSSRWKKTAVSGSEIYDGNVRGPTLQDKRSASLSHKRRRSLDKIIIDGLVDAKAPETSFSLPSAKYDSPNSIGGRQGELDEPSRQKKTDEVSPGGKLWKLMRKISTGGLKEKYAAYESNPLPPVPALPREFLESPPPPRGVFEIHSAPNSPADTKPSSRFVQGRSSFSGTSRPTVVPQRNTSGPPIPRKETRSPSTTGNRHAINSPNRPSITTRSSSPNSSDIASSKFWGRSRSTGSSVSSCAEDLPPVPKAGVCKHILTPSELFRLERETLDGDPSVSLESPTRSTKSGKHSPPITNLPSESRRSSEIIRPSLPIPPRRNDHHRVSSTPFPSTTQDSTSPTIPSFSTDQVINQFSSTRPYLTIKTVAQSPLPQAEFGVTLSATPPSPRWPSRSPRRATVTTTASALLPSDMEFDGNRTYSWQSGGSNASTAIQHRKPSAESSNSSFDSLARSPLKYRELGGPSRSAWTEKEKADRWDDLLQMSTQAGGTIHLSDGGGLLSDSLRLSDYSVN